MRFSFHAEQWLPRPVPVVFGLLANPDNLPRLMPAWQSARIDESSIVPAPELADQSSIQPPATVAAGVGTLLTLSFRPFAFSPIRATWEAEITAFAWNDHFCDRQLRGPFAYWNHCHRVAAASRNGVAGTAIEDHVDYELPFGAAGALANRLFLRRQLASTFAYRQQRLALLLAPVKP
jgi:ligand-binding SRPBCC domain-containing protein